MLTKPNDIFTIFHALSDPRQQAKVEHRLDEMIFMALCGAVCGIDTWTDLEEFVRVKIEWFRKYLMLENGVPSQDTFGRVFALLDTDEFHECLQRWVETLAVCLRDQGVHIDGKVLPKFRYRQRYESLDDGECMGMVYRSRIVKVKETCEVVYFISSLKPQVRRLAKQLRNHWTVENQLHWSLDVTFSEDASRIRKGASPEVAAGFRRLALSLIKQNTTRKASLRAKRLIASWDETFLEEILSKK